MTKRYTLTLSEEQLRVIDRACDVLSRAMAGQFDVITQDVMAYNPVPKQKEENAAYYVRRNRLADQLRLLEPLLTGLEQNVHHSIGSRQLGDAARVAYDVLKVIRFVQWQETGQPTFSVYRYPPEPMSKEPLPILALAVSEQKEPVPCE